jgi:hypothetical protein
VEAGKLVHFNKDEAAAPAEREMTLELFGDLVERLERTVSRHASYSAQIAHGHVALRPDRPCP